MGYSKNIQQALASFKKVKGSKKGFLFHQGQVFFFYDYEFCKIDYVKLSLSCQQLMIEYQLYNSTIDTIFIWAEQTKISITTDKVMLVYDSNAKQAESFKLALSYGILHDEERKCYLSGFVYINSTLSPRIYSSYFTAPDIAALIELLIFTKVPIVEPTLYENNPVLMDLAEKINQESLKALSKVYVKGTNIDKFD